MIGPLSLCDVIIMRLLYFDGTDLVRQCNCKDRLCSPSTLQTDWRRDNTLYFYSMISCSSLFWAVVYLTQVSCGLPEVNIRIIPSVGLYPPSFESVLPLWLINSGTSFLFLLQHVWVLLDHDQGKDLHKLQGNW